MNIYSTTYPIVKNLNELDIVSDITFSSVTSTLSTGGNLKVGKICHAYQFYNKNGAETIFSPVTQLINIVNSSETVSDSFDYKGSDSKEVSKKSVSLTITNNTDSFNRCRIVALEYSQLDVLPLIRIVGEYEIGDNETLTVSDGGQSIGNLALEEFRFINNDLIPKTLEIKDNRMLVGNLKYKYFSVPDSYDTRAFRFKNSTGVYTCEVLDGVSSFTVASNMGNLPPLNHECFNPFNDLDNDSNSAYQYKYNPDTGTLGGKGKYISYEFDYKEIILDKTTIVNDYQGGYPRMISKVNSPFENYCNPATPVGYQPGEIYRFGIVFFDKKGRPAFTKWIGDIRFPDINDYQFVSTASTSDPTKAKILGIKFTVNTTPIADLISGYQIVRAKREFQDSTVLSQGLLSYMAIDEQHRNHRFCTTDVPYISECYNRSITTARTAQTITDYSDGQRVLGTTTLDPYMLEYTSADVSFNKNIGNIDGTFIEVAGQYSNLRSVKVSHRGKGQLTAEKYTAVSGGSYLANTRFKTTVSDYKVMTPIERGNSTLRPELDSCLYTFENGVVYNNQCYNFVGENGKWGLRGTFLLLRVDTPLAIPNNTVFTQYSAKAMLAYIRVNRARNIYGGTGYEARKNTTYIKAGEFTTGSNSTVYGGDVYINMFTNLRGIWDQDSRSHNDRAQSILVFPTVSKINTDLRLDEIQKYMQWGIPGNEVNDNFVPNYALKETAQAGILAYSSAYPKEIGDLYRYNSVYSVEDRSVVYFEKPFDFTEVNYYDTRITISEKKINGEYIDNLLKFKFNNILDLDSRYDELIRLINFNNRIYAFQRNGISAVAVNDRVVVQSNSQAQLTLGTGGVLERFDYLTDNSGIQFYDAVVSTPVSFYYLDSNKKNIYRLNGSGEDPLSYLKGVNSYLKATTVNSVDSAYDPEYKEVLFNINGTILAYNEAYDTFTGFYSYAPDKFIRTPDHLYITKTNRNQLYGLALLNDTNYLLADDDPIKRIIISGDEQSELVTRFYKLNAGNPGEFYTDAGIAPVECSVTLIMNPGRSIVCSFDTLDFRTKVSSPADSDIWDKTFYKMIGSNSYQSFIKTFVYSPDYSQVSNLRRIARQWKTPIVGSTAYNANLKRMVDTFVMIKLIYQSDGSEFKIEDVSSFYRPISR